MKGKVYRLLYKLNEKCVIRVKTPVGETCEEVRDEGLGQGGIESGILSAASIGQGVAQFFQDSVHEILYGNVRMKPLILQDDVTRAAAGRLEAQAGNLLMESVAESKLLTFNQSKSKYIVIGSPQCKEKLLSDLEKNPLTLCGNVMGQAENYTYLGTVISAEGVTASVKESIKAKLGRVKQSINEIITIVENCRNNSIGGICSGIQIWEASVIPFLYHGSDCWVEVSVKEVNHRRVHEEALKNNKDVSNHRHVLAAGVLVTREHNNGKQIEVDPSSFPP